MKSLSVYYQVNCGLLLQTEQTSVLLDGLFRSSLFFSDMSPSYKTALHKSIPPFNRIEHLVFTHGHPDHFCLEEIESYIKNHCIKTLILPPESGEPENAAFRLQTILPKETSIIQPKSELLGSCITRKLNDIQLKLLRTPHIEAPFMARQHYSLFLQTGELCIFFSADSDFPDDSYMQILKQQHIDFGFFNPFFLMHKKGNEILRELNLKHSFIYHIPYKGDNNADFLDMIDNAFRYRSKKLPPLTVLTPNMPVFRLEK